MKRFLTLTLCCLAVALGAMAEEPKCVITHLTGDEDVVNLSDIDRIYYQYDESTDITTVGIKDISGQIETGYDVAQITSLTFTDIPTAINKVNADTAAKQHALKLLYQMGNIEFKDVNGKVIKTLKKQEE